MGPNVVTLATGRLRPLRLNEILVGGVRERVHYDIYLSGCCENPLLVPATSYLEREF